MAETYFVATPELARGLLEFVDSCGATIIDDRPDPNGHPVILRAGGWDGNTLLRARIFDLPIGAVSLAADQVDSAAAERRFFRQRYGSPYLDFIYYPPRIESGIQISGFGELSHYRDYFDIATNAKIVPTKVLTRLYSAMRQFIATRSGRARFPVHPKSVFVERGITGSGDSWNSFTVSRN